MQALFAEKNYKKREKLVSIYTHFPDLREGREFFFFLTILYDTR